MAGAVFGRAHLKEACVELGGDGLIIREGAQLEHAARGANFGSFIHQRQICMSTEKILVQKSVYDDFMSRFLARAANLRAGHTNDPDEIE